MHGVSLATIAQVNVSFSNLQCISIHLQALHSLEYFIDEMKSETPKLAGL